MFKQLIFTALLITACFANPSGLMAQVPPPQQGSTIDVRLLGESKNPWTEPSTIFGLVGTVGGLVGMLVQRLLQLRDEQRKNLQAERERLQFHLFDSLKWFEGRTQKRSIGIAVIEANWKTVEAMRPTWLAVLTNQAVYLLTKTEKTEEMEESKKSEKSDESDAAHEIANLERIMNLLNKAIPGSQSNALKSENSNPSDAAHKRANLELIMTFLCKAIPDSAILCLNKYKGYTDLGRQSKPRIAVPTLSAEQMSSIQKAIKENRAGKGLRGIEDGTINNWADWFGCEGSPKPPA